MDFILKISKKSSFLPQEGKGGEKTAAAQSHVDHSDGVLAGLFELVDSDTCDVTFVVVASGSGYHPDLSDTRARSTSMDGDGGEPRRGTPERARRQHESRTEHSTCSYSRSSSSAVSVEGVAGRDIAVEGVSDDRRRSSRQQVPSASTAATTEGIVRVAGRGGEREANRGGGGGECEKEVDELRPGGPPTTTSSTPRIPATTATCGGCNSRREFRCHRLLFASCSEYFRALLYGGMSESETRKVELSDVAPEAFEAIMTYVYTGRVRLAADNVMDIFSLAHRFGMDKLLRACAEVLDQCINCDDVCRVLEVAEYYGHAELATKCWDLIKENTPRVLKTESFLELPWPFLLTLVSDGELQVDEADLFQAVNAWVSKDPADRRHRVDELSGHFRLPLMSLRELMSVVRPSELLAADFILDAVTYHADPDQWSGDSLMVRPRGKRFRWDSSSLAAGAWTADDNRTVTTSVGDWVGVYGDRTMRSGFHRWSVRANKVGRSERKSAWGAIIGVAPPRSLNDSRPYLPVTGFIIGTGDRKLGGHTALDDYASVVVADGDVVTVAYDADGGVLSFCVNGASLGEAYTGLPGPMVAALAVNAAGAMWEMVVP